MNEEICYHENFHAQVQVARIEDKEAPFGMPSHFFADITVKCADCGEPFHFVGVPGGLSPNHPMVSATGEELRAPIAPGLKLIAKNKIEVF